MNAIIIDDEGQSRDALASLLKIYCPGVEMIGIANNGESGLSLIREKKPDVVCVFRKSSSHLSVSSQPKPVSDFSCYVMLASFRFYYPDKKAIRFK